MQQKFRVDVMNRRNPADTNEYFDVKVDDSTRKLIAERYNGSIVQYAKALVSVMYNDDMVVYSVQPLQSLYVAVNPVTGEFTGSCLMSDVQIENFDEECNPDGNWKLIKYDCINDPSFEFSKLMRLK